MNLEINTGISGRIRLVKHRDEVVSEDMEFQNLILNAGLDRWGTGRIIDRCFCGAGTAAPTPSDVSMGSLIATSTTTQTVTSYRTANATERWTEITICYRFAAGLGTGTWYEIGMGWDSGLWSRALIKDGSGLPTSITKLSDETVDVYYTLRIQFPVADITGSILLKGVTYDYVLRPAEISIAPSTPTAIFEAFAGSPTAASGDMRAGATAIGSVTAAAASSSWGGATSAAAYTPGSYKRRLTFDAGLNDLNVTGGFLSLGFFLRGGGINIQTAWQMGFYISGTPTAVPKTNAEVFSLTIDFSWARGS